MSRVSSYCLKGEHEECPGTDGVGRKCICIKCNHDDVLAAVVRIHRNPRLTELNAIRGYSSTAAKVRLSKAALMVYCDMWPMPRLSHEQVLLEMDRVVPRRDGVPWGYSSPHTGMMALVKVDILEERGVVPGVRNPKNDWTAYGLTDWAVEHLRQLGDLPPAIDVDTAP